MADGKSFAEMMSTFSRLTQLDDQIETAIKTSKIPTSQVRKFLRAEGTNAVRATALYQYLVDLFETLGIGEMQLIYRDTFEYIFGITNGTVPDLFPDVDNQPVCLPVVDLLKRFFTEDMGLECKVTETSCVRTGSSMCEFSVELKPLSVYPYILTTEDMSILDFAQDRNININVLSKEFSMDPEYVISRLEFLQKLGFLTRDNKLEPAASSAIKYIRSNPIEEVDFQPPWHDFAKIANQIAKSASFAEALKEVADEEVLPWEESSEVVVELKEKAEKSKSFAEFLANMENED